LGYDHETEDEAYQMEQLEINLLEKMNIENPYIEKNT
jgi:probable rRNA maturation factor